MDEKRARTVNIVRGQTHSRPGAHRAGPLRLHTVDPSIPFRGTRPVHPRIYGLRGERMRTLVDGDRLAVPNAVTRDGRDDHGRLVGAGTCLPPRMARAGLD